MKDSLKEILPGIGLGDIRFGMLSNNVFSILGSPNEIEIYCYFELPNAKSENWHYEDDELSIGFNEEEGWKLDTISINSDEIKAYAKVSFKGKRSLYEASFELMQRIFTDFDFVSGFTSIATPLNMVMKEKKGVCQDFAQIAIACLRSVGLPARYVSGYIETLPPPGKEKLIGSDASHAWFSVYIPKFGWIDFDPTNNQIPKNQHITVSYGRDYYDVAPLKGVIYSNGENKMKVSVDIRPDTDS